MISVLVVEDSRVEQEVLLHVLRSDPDLRIVGTASDGVEAVEMVARHRPDVVTMDLVMPRMSGIEATRRIMETTPVPVVVVSGNWGCEDVARASEAFAAGALAGVRKPRGPDASDYEELRGHLLRTLHQMAGVKVVRRWRRKHPEGNGNGAAKTALVDRPREGLKVVAVGVSTGGPAALEAMLSRLPASFPLPILIVQHIAEGFVDGLTEWLRRSTRLGVQLAENGQDRTRRPGVSGARWCSHGTRCGGQNRSRTFCSGAQPAPLGIVSLSLRSRGVRWKSDRRAAHRHGPGRRSGAAGAARSRRDHGRAERRELRRFRYAGRGDSPRGGAPRAAA